MRIKWFGITYPSGLIAIMKAYNLANILKKVDPMAKVEEIKAGRLFSSKKFGGAAFAYFFMQRRAARRTPQALAEQERESRLPARGSGRFMGVGKSARRKKSAFEKSQKPKRPGKPYIGKYT